MPVRRLFVVLLAVAALSGCGRRGDLEAPGAAPLAAGAVQTPVSDASPLDPGSNAAPAQTPAPPPLPPPKRRFFLDFLL